MKKMVLYSLALVLLASGLSTPVWAGASHVAAGDINGDGLDDLAILTGDYLEVAFAVGDGTFQLGRWVALDPGEPVDITMASVVGDSNPEIFVGFSDLGGVQVDAGAAQAIRVYNAGAGLNRISARYRSGVPTWLYLSFDVSEKGTLFRFDPASNGFRPLDTISYESPALDIALEHVVGDSEKDLAVLVASSLVVYVYDPSALELAPVAEITPIGPPRTQMDTGTIHGGGSQEIVLWSPESSDITVVGSAGGSTWTQSQFALGAAASVLAVGDVDGDGFADLPTISSAGNEIIFHHNQNGSAFSHSSISLPFSDEEMAIECGNFSTTQSGFVVVAPNTEGGPTILFVPVVSGSISSTVESDIPKPDAGMSAYANVVIRDASNPELVYWSQRVPDWTIGAALIGNNLIVEHETKSGNGLVPAPNVTFSGVNDPAMPTAIELAPNQAADDLSVFHLTQAFPAVLMRTLATPAGGTYGKTVEVALESREGTTIYYCKDGGTWQIYDPETSLLYFHRGGTLEAYATFGDYTGPIATETYEINQAYDADTDFDRVPDFVEDELGYNPLDGDRDSDDDGWYDLDELVRESDPKDSGSIPDDSDAPTAAELNEGIYGDGWSDFDEAFRQTDPNDRDSHPVVTGLEIPEAIVPIAVSESALETPAGAEGSRLVARLLTGSEIGSATLDDSPSLRVAADRPLVIGYTDNSDPEIILLAYNPRKTVDLEIDGDTNTSAESWLDAYTSKVRTELFEVRSVLEIDAESTAVVLALGRFIERALSLPAPNIIWTGSGTITFSEIDVLEQTVDLDEAASFLSENISDTSLPDLVRTYVDWAKSENIRGNIIERLAWLLHGWDPEEADAPDALLSAKNSSKIAAIDFEFIRNELDTLLTNIPTREVTLQGTLIRIDPGIPAVIDDGITYGFDSEGATFPVGSVVRITGRTITPSPYEGVVWVRITALEIVGEIPLGDNTDTNGNGLADQWENFYFPGIAVSPSADPDGDGYTNQQEYEGYSDPTNRLSFPSPDTSIQDWRIRAIPR
ncbi:MAG: VCBS repeat-containing protein [bacterium]